MLLTLKQHHTRVRASSRHHPSRQLAPLLRQYLQLLSGLLLCCQDCGCSCRLLLSLVCLYEGHLLVLQLLQLQLLQGCKAGHGLVPHQLLLTQDTYDQHAKTHKLSVLHNPSATVLSQATLHVNTVASLQALRLTVVNKYCA
jgi:hypothetical protein